MDSLSWSAEEQLHGKSVHVKDFLKGHRLQLFRLVLSTERTDYVVTNDTAQDSMIDTQQVCAVRWRNTAAPLFYGQHEQVEKTKAFLSDKVLSVDIFALRNSATDELIAPVAQDKPQTVKVEPEQESTAEVVIFNRRAAHSFPPELRDMYEPWVEFEAIDANNKSIYHSGFVKPDKTLDERAHVYKSLLLDSFSRVVTRHLSAAIAEMRMERYAFNEQSQLNKAKELIERALRVSPEAPRGRFYQAVILRSLNQHKKAAEILADLAKMYPRDREVWRQMDKRYTRSGK